MSSADGVRAFYSGKNIFITGGSGFLGVCLLEKIIRTIPEHGDVYLLLRPKRGKAIEERLEEIKKNSVFEKLLEEKSLEELFAKVKVVGGDVGSDNLGLSPEDRNLLTNKINVIVHSAATLDFAETLANNINVNLLGTRRVTEFAKVCSNLKVLIHVSSAYVNSYKLETEEIIYPLTRDADELIALSKKMSPEELENQAADIAGEHPNSYTLTKHMAEHEIQKIQEKVPCTIVRPSMIIGSLHEPVPGWTVSKNGPQGFFMGAAKGIIRRIPLRKELIADYIPVDIVVNQLLVAGFHAGVTETKTVDVYHCTSSTRNPFYWAMVDDEVNDHLHAYPLMSAVWYPQLKFVPYIWLFKIAAIFVHFIPALLLDGLAIATGGRPILVKLHRNINSSLDRLSKFIFTEWKFNAQKTDELHKWLGKSDQEDFGLDISEIVWTDYFRNMAIGTRIYLNKEPLKNLKFAQNRNNILMFVHYGTQVFAYLLLWMAFSFLSGVGILKGAAIIPLTFIGLSYI